MTESVKLESVYGHDFPVPLANKKCFQAKKDYRLHRRLVEWHHQPIVHGFPAEESESDSSPKLAKSPDGPEKSPISDEGLGMELSPAGSQVDVGEKSPRILDQSARKVEGSSSVPRLVLEESPTPTRAPPGGDLEKMVEDPRRPLTPPWKFAIETGVQTSINGDHSKRALASKSTQTPESWLKSRKRTRDGAVGSGVRFFRGKSSEKLGRRRRAVSSPPWFRRRSPFAYYGMGNRGPSMAEKRTFNVKASSNKYETAIRAQKARGPNVKFTSLIHENQEKYRKEPKNSSAVFDRLKIGEEKKISKNVRLVNHGDAKRKIPSKKYGERFVTEYQRAFCKNYQLDTFASLVKRES